MSLPTDSNKSRLDILSEVACQSRQQEDADAELLSQNTITTTAAAITTHSSPSNSNHVNIMDSTVSTASGLEELDSTTRQAELDAQEAAINSAVNSASIGAVGLMSDFQVGKLSQANLLRESLGYQNRVQIPGAMPNTTALTINTSIPNNLELYEELSSDRILSLDQRHLGVQTHPILSNQVSVSNLNNQLSNQLSTTIIEEQIIDLTTKIDKTNNDFDRQDLLLDEKYKNDKRELLERKTNSINQLNLKLNGFIEIQGGPG